MKKVAVLAVIAAMTMSVSAQSETVRHKHKLASSQKLCWILTDYRGFGYWESCGTRTDPRRAIQDLPTINGGGGGGGGGGNGR
jgi:hypothetical protein